MIRHVKSNEWVKVQSRTQRTCALLPILQPPVSPTTAQPVSPTTAQPVSTTTQPPAAAQTAAVVTTAQPVSTTAQPPAAAQTTAVVSTAQPVPTTAQPPAAQTAAAVNTATRVHPTYKLSELTPAIVVREPELYMDKYLQYVMDNHVPDMSNCAEVTIKEVEFWKKRKRGKRKERKKGHRNLRGVCGVWFNDSIDFGIEWNQWPVRFTRSNGKKKDLVPQFTVAVAIKYVSKMVRARTDVYV